MAFHYAEHFFVGTILVPTECERTFTSFRVSEQRGTEEKTDDLPEDLVENMRALSSSEAMGGEVLNQPLTKDIVSEIIASIPFPELFKARSLSKSWRIRFSSIRDTDDQAIKVFKNGFQSRVGLNRGLKWSNNWGSFCPVCCLNQHFFAFDPVCQLWRRIILPEIYRDFQPLVYNNSLQIEGVLLYGFPVSHDNGYRQPEITLCVANIFTRWYMQLPLGPHPATVIKKKLVKNISTETFKVIVLCRESTFQYSVEIYDSSLNIWRSKRFFIFAGNADFGDTCLLRDTAAYLRDTAAYLNGVFYMVGSEERDVVFAFNVEEGTVEQIQLSLAALPQYNRVFAQLLVCNGNLNMIIIPWTYPDLPRTVHLFKIDLASLSMLEVARGPPPSLNVTGLCMQLIASDGDYIFLDVDRVGSSGIVLYNVVSDEWSCFPTPDEGNGDDDYSSIQWIHGSAYL